MSPLSKPVRRLVRGALIAAIYAVLCIVLQPISFSEIQFRVSEALTVLPILMPEAIPGPVSYTHLTPPTTIRV